MSIIFNHEKSGYKYKIVELKQNNGNVKKFVYVNKNGNPVMDKDNYIYLNKSTGDIITGNGKKYVVNKLTKQLARNSNGYIIEENNNSFSGLPRRIKNLSIAPPKQNNSPYKGTMFNSSLKAPPSNLVPTVYGPGVKSVPKPGFRLTP